ncbi:hypothetical protein [Amycolatopsis sp. NPDC051071]|uniref:hypothetical protein n=1 Tax=Amycolatopsis sp. NPDC051071 TaxID=3154637 RepID=UPI003419D444
MWSDAELDQALADLHPEPETRQDELSRAKAALLRAAGEVDDELLPVSGPPSKKRPGAWRWIAAAAAAALIPGGVIVATNVFVDNDGQDTANHATLAPVDDVLSNLRGADLPLRAGQYRLSTESTWTTWVGKTSGVIYQTHEIFERWLPADWSLPRMTRFTRTGEIRWIKGDYGTAKALGEPIPSATIDTGWEGQPSPPTGGQASGARPTSTPIAPPQSGSTTTNLPPEAPVATKLTQDAPISTQRSKPPKTSWMTPSRELLDELPTDPAKLLERLRNDNRDGEVITAPEMFDMAHSVMRSSHGYGDLRVALCKALAKAPGITFEKNATTSDHRPVISFSVQEADRIKTLVVDLATANITDYRAARNRSDPEFPGLSLHETTVTTQVTDKGGP